MIGGVKKNQSAMNNLIAPIVQGLGYSYIGCEMRYQGRNTVLSIYIDKIDKENAQGYYSAITVADCSRVTKQLVTVLQVEQPMHDYQIEVSSPGLERPLYTQSQFELLIGKKIKITLIKPQNGRRNFLGNLAAIMVESGSVKITLNCEKEDYSFAFENIEKANVIFDASIVQSQARKKNKKLNII